MGQLRASRRSGGDGVDDAGHGLPQQSGAEATLGVAAVAGEPRDERGADLVATAGVAALAAGQVGDVDRRGLRVKACVGFAAFALQSRCHGRVGCACFGSRLTGPEREDHA